jgi:hypothetical protein
VAARPRGARPGGWRTCSKHPGTPSEGVCSQCGNGWCAECVQHHGTAVICPDCDALCVTTAQKEEAERLARQRRRPLRDELGIIFSYPLRDPLAYIMMAVVVGLAATAARMAVFGAIFGVLISQGLLYAYAFTAINRVSAGNTTNFMPDVGDIGDLVKAVFLGLAAMIVSRGPTLVLLFVLGASSIFAVMGTVRHSPDVEATPMPEELRTMLEEEGLSNEEIAQMQQRYGGTEGASAQSALGVSVAALIALPFALLWWLLYAPIALIAAAISQSFFATLNPITGVDAIRRMGSVYWEAWLIYVGIAIAGGIVAGILGIMPFIGAFLAAFVQSYAFLAVGCLLGFAVFKKAEELGVD